MNYFPLITIIIPSFNSGSHIQRCLDSIVQQTFDNYEVLIMDGMSTDNTLEIIKTYSDRHINCISERDNGIYDAMNKGIKKASGEWIYFLGSDDYLLEKNVLLELTKKINLDDFDFVYGNVYSPEYGEKYDGGFDWQKLVEKNICHQAVFVRKKLFQQIGYFNTRYKLLADYDFNLKCWSKKSIRKTYIDSMIAYYSPSGSSSTINDKNFTRDKKWLVLKYGFSTYSWRQRIQMFKQILIDIKAGKN